MTLYQFLLYSNVNQLYVYIYRAPFSLLFFPFRSPQSTEKSSLCYRVGSLQLSVLYVVVYICQSPSSSHSLLCSFNLSHLKQRLFGKINIFLGQHAEQFAKTINILKRLKFYKLLFCLIANLQKTCKSKEFCKNMLASSETFQNC